MGATRFLKKYTQKACEQALNEGFSVGVVGLMRPATNKISAPHRVQEVKVGDKIIGYNINKLYLPQSDDWDKYLKLIQDKPGERITGFPFSVRWPKMYGGKKYQIILVSGFLLDAKVDDSREFMSEGLEWGTKEGNKSQSVVVAWKQL